MVSMSGRDLVIAEVVERLRIGRSTLDQWLANDILRPVGERRFQFHTFRGAKRVWTEAAFQNLQKAIEHESLSGGVLARSSSRNVMAIGTPRAPSLPAVDQYASEKVSAFPLRPPPSDKRKFRSQSTSMTKRRVSPGPRGVVIPLR
jgi:hypothetical protein